MRYVRREIEEVLMDGFKSFPSLVLTGPRRAGKTWVLRHLFPEAQYYLLEAPDVLARVREDPEGFLDEIQTPAILDEIQNAPELFAHVRARIDKAPRRVGQWILTGSQESSLMHGVSESMAGRAAVFQLLPMSSRESEKVSILRGGFPEVLARPSAYKVWFSSYTQTYLERDVRAVAAIRDLSTFRRFLALLATRHGQVLNRSDLAGPLGVTVPTLTHWLSILETTGQIVLVPPYYENVGKRLIKSPKLYLLDSGLACHLLGIESLAELNRSPFRGALFEGLIASEILKAQVSTGKRKELYYFRDEQGLEVDFVLVGKARKVQLIECKFTHSPTPALVGPMQRLAESFVKQERPKPQLTLVCQLPKAGLITRAIAPGVKIQSWQELAAGV